MTREEVTAVLYLINSNYPNVRTTPEEAKNRVNLWADAFQDYDAQTVINAVKVHINDRKAGRYYPTIADIKGKLQIADNLQALAATVRNAPQRPQLPRTDAQAVRTYKTLVSEFDTADKQNSVCYLDEGRACALDYFKAYRMRGTCDTCPNKPKQIQGGNT